MRARITRRTFVGWLMGSASAVATIGLLPAERASAAPERSLSPNRSQALIPGSISVRASGKPVSVRMADLVLEGRAFWAGLADGVRLPSQGGDVWALTAERAGGVYTSPALQAEFPCTHVGVHWKTDGGDDSALRVELRASRDGQTWMPWKRLQRDMHGPDQSGSAGEPGQAESFAALVHARLGSWLQARLTFGAAGPATAAVASLTLTCLDSRRVVPGPEGESAEIPYPLTPSPVRGGGGTG
jgi:hypothetical protein